MHGALRCTRCPQGEPRCAGGVGPWRELGSFRFGKEERWEVSLAYASWELQGEMLREGNVVKSLSRDLIQDVSIQKQRGETR